MRVCVIRVNGAEEWHDVAPATVFTTIERLIGAAPLRRLPLPRAQTLLVGQRGQGLVNLRASRIAGRDVAGDAALIREGDFR